MLSVNKKAGCLVDTQLVCTTEDCGLLFKQSSILCKLSLFGLNVSGVSSSEYTIVYLALFTLLCGWNNSV